MLYTVEFLFNYFGIIYFRFFLYYYCINIMGSFYILKAVDFSFKLYMKISFCIVECLVGSYLMGILIFRLSI